MTYGNPDITRSEYGLRIHEHIIPWGAVWPRTVYGKGGSVKFPQGSPYKADRLLTNGSGTVRYVTIHTTGAVSPSPTLSMAAQYARAAWPHANLSDWRFHYYIDQRECWQLLREDEVGWHADGRGPGNETSLAVAIIRDGRDSDSDRLAEERGALLAAILLHRHGLGIDRLTTHRYWNRHTRCPAFSPPHWQAFRARTAAYLAAIGAAEAEADSGYAPLHRGDLVGIAAGAVFLTGKPVPTYIQAQRWFIGEEPRGDRVVLAENEHRTEAICSPVGRSYLSLVRAASAPPTHYR